MAENDEHRRVEARTAIPGSGMLTEPDRIRALEEDAERKKRAWRPAPAEGFSSVLSRTPARESERVGTYVPADERLPASERAALDEARDGADAKARDGSPAADDDAADGDQQRARGDDARTPTSRDSSPPRDDSSSREARDARAVPRGKVRPNEVVDPRVAALNRLLDEKSRKKAP